MFYVHFFAYINAFFYVSFLSLHTHYKCNPNYTPTSVRRFFVASASYSAVARLSGLTEPAPDCTQSGATPNDCTRSTVLIRVTRSSSSTASIRWRISPSTSALPETAIAGALTLNAGVAFSLPIIPAPLMVLSCGSDGTRAQLTVNKGRVTFKGDPDAAADMFIETHVQQRSVQQAQLNEAEAQLAAYSHHNGLMMLSQRLVDAEKERDALREEVNQLRGLINRVGRKLTGLPEAYNVHCNQ